MTVVKPDKVLQLIIEGSGVKRLLFEAMTYGIDLGEEYDIDDFELLVVEYGKISAELKPGKGPDRMEVSDDDVPF